MPGCPGEWLTRSAARNDASKRSQALGATFHTYKMLTLASDRAVDAAAMRLRASLASPGLDQAVAAYFAEPEFAGVTFTTLGLNPPGEITCDDLVAVSLLDITWRPRVVRILMDQRGTELGELLAAVPTDLDLSAPADQHPTPSALPRYP